MAQKGVDSSKSPPNTSGIGSAIPPATPPPAEAIKPTQNRASEELSNWQPDSQYDSKNITSTRDLDDFISTLAASNWSHPV